MGEGPAAGGTDGVGLVVVLVLAALVLFAGSLLVERRDLQTP